MGKDLNRVRSGVSSKRQSQEWSEQKSFGRYGYLQMGGAILIVTLFSGVFFLVLESFVQQRAGLRTFHEVSDRFFSSNTGQELGNSLGALLPGIAALVLALRAMSWKVASRPADVKLERAWLERVIDDSNKEDVVLALTFVLSALYGDAVLLYALLAARGHWPYDMLVMTIFYVTLYFVVAVMPAFMQVGDAGRVSGYASSLRRVGYLVEWCYRREGVALFKGSGGEVGRKFDRPKRWEAAWWRRIGWTVFRCFLTSVAPTLVGIVLFLACLAPSFPEGIGQLLAWVIVVFVPLATVSSAYVIVYKIDAIADGGFPVLGVTVVGMFALGLIMLALTSWQSLPLDNIESWRRYCVGAGFAVQIVCWFVVELSILTLTPECVVCTKNYDGLLKSVGCWVLMLLGVQGVKEELLQGVHEKLGEQRRLVDSYLPASSDVTRIGDDDREVSDLVHVGDIVVPKGVVMVRKSADGKRVSHDLRKGMGKLFGDGLMWFHE